MINRALKGLVWYLALFSGVSAMNRQESRQEVRGGQAIDAGLVDLRVRLIASDGLTAIATPVTRLQFDLPVSDKFGNCTTAPITCDIEECYEGNYGTSVSLACPYKSVMTYDGVVQPSSGFSGFFPKGKHVMSCSSTDCTGKTERPHADVSNNGCSLFRDEEACESAILHNEPVIKVSCKKM